MRTARSAALALLILTGCISDDCIPEPTEDATPPQVRIVVHYTAPGSGTETTRVVTQADSSAVVTASRNERVRVTFEAADSSGVRRLAPAVTVQRTVGVGVEREFAPIDETTSRCPVTDLHAEYEAHTSGAPRVLIVTALAENWMGGRSSVEPISIRME